MRFSLVVRTRICGLAVLCGSHPAKSSMKNDPGWQATISAMSKSTKISMPGQNIRVSLSERNCTERNGRQESIHRSVPHS